jgi:hypothetical protein
MTAGFIPPPNWTEIASQLKTSGNAVLNAAGIASIPFSPDHANQRWVISSVVCSTNQPSQSLCVPYATLALNTTDITQMSQGNQRGTTYNGYQNTFSGAMDVGPCDFVSVLFYPPPGATGAQIAALSGVMASVVISGTKYTRRA